MNNAAAAAAGASGALDIALAREEALAGFKDINWGTYTRSGGFSLEQEDVDVLRSMEALEKQSGDSAETLNKQTDEFLVESGSTIASALLKLIGNVTEASVVKYALARMQTLLADGVRQRKRMAYFVNKGETLDASPFLRRIRDEKGYIQAASANLLALFLTVYPSTSDIQALIEWGVKGLKADDGSVTRASVNSMMILLRSNIARGIFAKAGGISAVVDLLKTSRAQQAYELTFILWALSYNDEALEKFVSAQAVTSLIEQVNAAPREKVVRVALETLNNMVGKREGFFNERMIDGGLLKTLTSMRDRKWTDEDITTNIQKIRDVLIREYKELNTMERYEKELRTGTLNWGLLHTDKFWKENFMQFEQKEFELIRLLIDLLDSEDPKTVAVALYDLGEFVRFYPNGKHISKRLGAKKAAMKLMTHDNPEVQKQALQCISKMMVNKWEFVK